ncbi:MAG: sulfotransferase domain-containing protein, partial [Gammaproteobacteria bacterium]|nr:sulfotransferase domain-containing protein [Gammaproteobacteria bacterium]
FIGLVRNGLAVCEGHIRRGSTASAYGKLYARVCGQILADAQRLDNFHLFRYEDLTRDTLKTAKQIFEFANLDGDCVPKFRLVVGNEGNPGRTGGSAVELRWFSPKEFAETITPGVDEEQIQKLTSKDRDNFLAEAGGILTSLGYAT